MMMTKMKIATALVLAFGLLAAGGTLAQESKSATWL
jgi:hypothetical protein